MYALKSLLLADGEKQLHGRMPQVVGVHQGQHVAQTHGVVRAQRCPVSPQDAALQHQMNRLADHVASQPLLLRQHHVQMTLQQNGRCGLAAGGGGNANQNVSGGVADGLVPPFFRQRHDPVAQRLLVAAAVGDGADILEALKNAPRFKILCQIHRTSPCFNSAA